MTYPKKTGQHKVHESKTKASNKEETVEQRTKPTTQRKTLAFRHLNSVQKKDFHEQTILNPKK
jgi:hypothetical protein